MLSQAAHQRFQAGESRCRTHAPRAGLNKVGSDSGRCQVPGQATVEWGQCLIAGGQPVVVRSGIFTVKVQPDQAHAGPAADLRANAMAWRASSRAPHRRPIST